MHIILIRIGMLEFSLPKKKPRKILFFLKNIYLCVCFFSFSFCSMYKTIIRKETFTLSGQLLFSHLYVFVFPFLPLLIEKRNTRIRHFVLLFFLLLLQICSSFFILLIRAFMRMFRQMY